MSSQRQAPRLSHPRSVTFVLAGRTTLSEHSPTENIEVDYCIAERSPYLRNFLPQHVSSDRPLLPVQLGDVDLAGFRLYISWLSTDTVDPLSQTPIFLQSCTDFIYAHIVGATFDEPNFQDQVIDVLSDMLDPAQVPDLKVLEILFLEKHASSLLKRFVIDKMFAHERKMLGMLRGFVEDMVTGKSYVKGCEYHVHDEVGKCYKQGREARGAQNATSVKVEKKWSIDDDAELNAMAAHYLGKTSSVPENSSKVSKASVRPRLTMTPVLMDGDVVMNSSTAPPSTRSNSRNIHTSSLHYQGSAAWSRELQSPRTSVRSLDPQLDLDKPLPPPPPPPSRPAPRLPPVGPLKTAHIERENEPQLVRPSDTRNLVLECLGRLSPTTTKPSTQDLIEECLARVAPSPTTFMDMVHDDGSDEDDDDDNDDDDDSIQPSPALSTHSISSSSSDDTLPPSLRPGPLPSPPISREFSFVPLPKPRFFASKPAPPARISPPLTPPYHLSSTPDLPPLIKRKPAPPRGTDWLKQWDRLHALKGTQGFGLRKQVQGERKSKFREILGSVRA
jgi:hypothetical protein